MTCWFLQLGSVLKKLNDCDHGNRRLLGMLPSKLMGYLKIRNDRLRVGHSGTSSNVRAAIIAAIKVAFKAGVTTVAAG